MWRACRAVRSIFFAIAFKPPSPLKGVQEKQRQKRILAAIPARLYLPEPHGRMYAACPTLPTTPACTPTRFLKLYRFYITLFKI